MNTPGIYTDIASILCSKSIESSASITSDSIALWLASQLSDHAERVNEAAQIDVLILKSCEVPAQISHDAVALSSQEMVDAAFPRYAENLSMHEHASWRVINVTDYLKPLT
jgi:aspartokinase-like uncharacterized kinase